jgi:hypothetical protein
MLKHQHNSQGNYSALQVVIEIVGSHLLQHNSYTTIVARPFLQHMKLQHFTKSAM